MELSSVLGPNHQILGHKIGIHLPEHDLMHWGVRTNNEQVSGVYITKTPQHSMSFFLDLEEAELNLSYPFRRYTECTGSRKFKDSLA